MKKAERYAMTHRIASHVHKLFFIRIMGLFVFFVDKVSCMNTNQLYMPVRLILNKRKHFATNQISVGNKKMKISGMENKTFREEKHPNWQGSDAFNSGSHFSSNRLSPTLNE